jgi:prepilin-type N-terminal cleavage/methylation domain-containing protein
MGCLPAVLTDMIRLKYARVKAGFTLIELLLVLAIISILSVLSVLAISSLQGSGNMNKNISALSGSLELAREYAVSKNTYVWVAFYPSSASNGLNLLSVAVLASNDGSDPASATPSWATYNYGTVPTSEISLINKIVTLQQISMLNAASLSPNSLPTTPAVTSGANSIATGNFFALALPGTPAPVTFTQAIEFLPTGQVRNSSNPVDAIDLDVQPEKGNVQDTKNIAVLRINGLTGQTVVYRNE